MSAPIEYSVREEGGQYYAVVPLAAFTQLLDKAQETDALTIPHDIARRHLLEGVSLIRGWREYLSLSQQDLASRLAVSQSQIAQWERPEARPRHASLKRIADALGIHVKQLEEE